jgi:hypothetical protein
MEIQVVGLQPYSGLIPGIFCYALESQAPIHSILGLMSVDKYSNSHAVSSRTSQVTPGLYKYYYY